MNVDPVRGFLQDALLVKKMVTDILNVPLVLQFQEEIAWLAPHQATVNNVKPSISKMKLISVNFAVILCLFANTAAVQHNAILVKKVIFCQRKKEISQINVFVIRILLLVGIVILVHNQIFAWNAKMDIL